MNPYTVLLQYPEYSSPGIAENYLAWATGADVAAAIADARSQCEKQNGVVAGDWGEALHVIAVFPGHLTDIKPDQD